MSLKSVSSQASLIKFYGQECGFCHQMEPLDERLEKELRVKLERLEVWHNEENANKMFSLQTGCQGVPMYYNEDSKAVLCGAVDYDVLKGWAKGEDPNQPEHSHEGDQHNQLHKDHQ
ncbi:thioredoxin family protein [Candidatus Curtissbacteria bacterium]|nr:thioredoxin family protein [Candidatus Curtissbacteria bacterium]